MLWGHEVETSPFMHTHWMHVARTVRKLVLTKQFYVVAGTVCKTSAHDMTLKTEIILSLLHDT